jgi:Protein of unknown function (DUF1236)
MRYLLASAAAAMALVSVATIGNAQSQKDDKGEGPSAGSPGAQSEPGEGKSKQPKRADPKAEPRKGAEKDSGKDQPRATQQQPKEQPRRTQDPQPGKDQPKSATPVQQGKDLQKSTQQPQLGKDQPKSTESPQQGKDEPKAASPQQKLDKVQQKSSQPMDQKQGAPVQVSEQQRTGVRERLTKESRVERTKVRLSANVGATIPRSVRLHVLPVAIISLAPAYRGYSYIVLEDETICIVDERTYLIVDVIPAGAQRADRRDRQQLALSTEQMRFIFSSVPKDGAAHVRVRLALGAEVPRDVELRDFPAVVLGRVPEVGRYRYIVAGSDVAIVDPNDNAVVLVINE